MMWPDKPILSENSNSNISHEAYMVQISQTMLFVRMKYNWALAEATEW